MKHYSTKDSLIVGALCFVVFMVLIFIANFIYPCMSLDFALFCALGVGVGNFFTYRFFLKKN